MKLIQLEALIAIADGEGIAGAAELLNLSQPAITKNLSNLEHAMGMELIDRSNYRLTLNIYGETLLTHAKAIKSETDKAKQALILLKEKQQQVVSLSGSSGPMANLIPEAIKLARRDFPDLDVILNG